VNKILPLPWGLLGATWRLAPPHQLIGALDPPAVTSVSTPNTRSLIFVHGGVGPGVRPFWARSPRKGLGAKGAWVRFGSWLGSDRQHRRGSCYRQHQRGRGGQKAAPKAWHCIYAPRGVWRGACADPRYLRTWYYPWRPLSCPSLRCYCGALTNHRAQVECVTGCNAPRWSFHSHRPGSSGTQFRNFSLAFTCLGSWGVPPYI
jgi:hypothetical protein